MASITSAGLGSGLDVNGIVQKLMAVEQQPLTRMAQKEASYQAKLTAYGTIQGALSSFQSTMSGLASAARYNAISASSSDSATVSASATSIAAVGNYSLQIDKLAQKQSLASTVFTDTTSAVGTGTLNIQFGEYSGGTYTQNADKTSFSVTIDSSNNTLTGLRDAINKANGGVTATIVNTGSGFKLALTSNDTGVKNAIKLTVDEGTGLAADNIDTNGLSKLAYDPAATAGSGKNMTESQAASNAELWVNGVFVSKSSNTVTEVIQGVTLTLAKTTTSGSPVSVSVGRSTSSLSSAAADMVKSFNDLNKTIRDLTAYDSKTKQAGMLQGDFAPTSILTQIRRALGTNISGLDGKSMNLSQLGISFQKDGSLALDSTKLSAAIEANPNIVAGFFASTGLPTDDKITFVSKTASTAVGQYALNVSQLATQGKTAGSAAPSSLIITPGVNDTIVATINGTATSVTLPSSTRGNQIGNAAPTSLVIDNSNDTFTATIDGSAVSVSLTQNTYADADALAAEIQTQINSALAALPSSKTVTASVSGGKISVTSATYGTTSTVSLTGAGATNFLGGAGTSTTGTNPYADTATLATGLQSKLNGALSSNGLSVAVSVSGGMLSITSDTYGSASSVVISGNGANNLLGAGRTNTAGVDVAGTINGASATGSGQTLTSDNGLKLSVGGTSTGDRGYIYISDGFATKLSSLAQQLLDKNGTVSAAQGGLNALIKDVQTRSAQFQLRLTDIEARYRAQFTSLDTLMSKMSSTSNYLTQQLASLSSLSS